MPSELPPISVKITADSTKLEAGIRSANSQLGQLRGKLADAEKAFIKYSAAAGVAAGSLATMKLVSVTREFDKLNAGLVTATGSAAGAAQAFDALRDFAATTPYSLQQATDGFTKLVNLGLDPSERALKAYGNTAAAMGKDLNQMIEAVADAATGEFERLKEFGIKASKEGDRVKFMFQGVETEVANSSAAIEGYLKSLGENQFAGAMQNRVDSLDGALSNLEDSWNQLFLTVSEQGAGDVIEGGVRMAIAGIEELTKMLESGQLAAQIKAMGMSFDGVTQDILAMADFAQEAIEQMGSNSDMGAQGIIDAFANMPENIRAFIQLMTVELAAFVDKAGAYGSEIADKLKFWDGDTYNMDQRLADIAATRDASIEAILAERDTFIEAKQLEFESAEQLRKKYDELNENRAKGDKLAEFRVDNIAAQNARELEMLTKHNASVLKEKTKAAQAEQKLASQTRNQVLGDTGNFLGQMAQMQDGESRKSFNRKKQFGIAQALVSTYQGIAEGVSLGWPMMIPAIAAAAATGFAQVQAIKSTSYSSGGGAAAPAAPAVSFPGGGGPSDRQLGGQSGSETGTNMFVKGINPSDMFSGEQLVDMINMAQEQGAVLRLG